MFEVLTEILFSLKRILLIQNTPLGNLQQLFAAGGIVLYLLLITALILWGLLIERIWFRLVEYPKALLECQNTTNKRSSDINFFNLQQSLQRSMGLIRTTINVCPLLGLAGTVLGMIEIFEVIAQSGSSNAQLMALGVSKAILPTMASMVIAISAMFLFAYLQRWSQKQQLQLKRLAISWDIKPDAL